MRQVPSCLDLLDTDTEARPVRSEINSAVRPSVQLRVAVAQNFLPEIERVAVLKTREILEHAAHGNVARANHTESPREIRDGAAGGKLFS